MKQIKLTQGKCAIVDDEDYEKLTKYEWHYALGYARRNIRLDNGKRKMVFMHREIMNTPDGLYTDHINGKTLDNRKENLRVVTQTQNAQNARKRAKARSKYKGVYYQKRKRDAYGKWASKIQVDNKGVFVGYFPTEKQAALAYNEAAKKYHKEYANLNDIEETKMDDYQKKAARTIPKERWFNTNLSNFSMGLSGEVGEVIDNFKKYLYHDHELDRDEIEKELGDVLWYLSSIATVMRMDLSTIADKNIEKLIERYPEGFDEELSKNRKEYKS